VQRYLNGRGPELRVVYRRTGAVWQRIKQFYVCHALSRVVGLSGGRRPYFRAGAHLGFVIGESDAANAVADRGSSTSPPPPAVDSDPARRAHQVAGLIMVNNIYV
jgi:hypothetical protein